MGSLVLCSGGYDSSLCAVTAVQRDHERPLLCFFNYGQSFLAQEREAVAYLSRTLSLEQIELKVPAMSSADNGVVPNRNETFLRLALEHRREPMVYFGCRNPTPFDKYKDSNLWWAWRMEKRYRVTMRLPCLALPKGIIERRLMEAGLDLQRLFCSEGIKP